MVFYGTTDIGMKRTENQDSFRIKQYSPEVALAVVCDGMGGARGGAVASSVAISEFVRYLDENYRVFTDDLSSSDADEKISGILKEAVSSANTAVFTAAYSTEELYGMGTTLVAALLTPEKVYAVNVGDSRMYSRTEGELSQVTRDHSYVQYLVDIGKLSPQNMKDAPNKNIITRAVGTDSDVEADVYTLPVSCGSEASFILLCSDGLSNLVEPRDLEDALRRIEASPTAEDLQRTVEDAIALANKRGGNDNITSVILAY